RLDTRVQVDLVPFALIDAGKESKVFHDLLDSAQAFSRPFDELWQVREGILQIERVTNLINAAQCRLFLRIVRASELAVSADQGNQVVEVTFENRDVIVDESERVIDLMRNAGDELSKAGKFLGVHHAALRGLEGFVRRSLGFGQVL